MVMGNGDKPYTAKDLFLKLSKLWKFSGNWKLVSLGEVSEFEFSSLEDMRKAWAHGTMNLRPGVLRLSHEFMKGVGTWYYEFKAWAHLVLILRHT